METQQCTDKASEYNGRVVSSRAVVKQEWCQLRPIIYPLYSLHFLTIFTKFPFLPSLPPPTQYVSTTNRVRRPLGSGVYDCVAPRLPNKANTTMMAYPAAVNLSDNHCAARDASVIVTLSGINNVFPFILLLFLPISSSLTETQTSGGGRGSPRRPPTVPPHPRSQPWV